MHTEFTCVGWCTVSADQQRGFAAATSHRTHHRSERDTITYDAGALALPRSSTYAHIRWSGVTAPLAESYACSGNDVPTLSWTYSSVCASVDVTAELPGLSSTCPVAGMQSNGTFASPTHAGHTGHVIAIAAATKAASAAC